MTSGGNPLMVGRSVLKPDRPVGIVGYGAYVPQFRLPASEVARVWTGGLGGVPVKEKAVAGLDEDVITMAIEAARKYIGKGQVGFLTQLEERLGKDGNWDADGGDDPG